MADLNELMGLEGAIAAFSMNDRGELLEHQVAAGSDLNAQALDLLSHMCVANMAIATMQARGWEASSQHQGFYPVEGFTLVGFDWSAVTDGRLGVVLSNQQADYQAAYDLLAQQGARVIRRLLALDGVIAVSQFRDDGAYVAGYGILPEQDLQALAHFAHDYKRIVQGNADQLSMFTQLPGWTPPGGWAVRGSGMTVCSVGNLVCIVENADASVTEVMRELAEVARY